MDRAALLESRRLVLAAAKAGEPWHSSYKRNKALFRRLTEAEAALETSAAEYLYNLSRRAPAYVDWSVYAGELAKQPKLQAGIKAAADPVSSEPWEAEAFEFQRAVIDAITIVATIGAEAAYERYGLPLTVSDYGDLVSDAARNHVATLVSGVTETSRDQIRRALRDSLARGESSDLAMERIMKTINNPVRAEMIAQTESVNAYTMGTLAYAEETGAKKKTWEALVDACDVCAPLDGKTIKLSEKFKLNDGTEVDGPTSHVRCRCGVYVEY
ncbi:phage minor head protein [Dietzia sp. MNB45]|uniref:phage minor head protein n=1 Tax=Dietzia sp. MNB45 TaxID=3238800 RepID=UPI003F7EAFA7